MEVAVELPSQGNPLPPQALNTDLVRVKPVPDFFERTAASVILKLLLDDPG